MDTCRRFGDGWLKACSRGSRSFVSEIVDRRLELSAGFDGSTAAMPAAVEEREGIHYVAGTGVPVALLTYLHFERGYANDLLLRCFSDLTPGRIERALEWVVEHPRQTGRERRWLLGVPLEEVETDEQDELNEPVQADAMREPREPTPNSLRNPKARS